MAHTVSSTRKYFFKELVVSATEFPNDPQVKFPFLASRVVIANDNDDYCLEYSFLKPHIDGKLRCDDGPFSMDWVAESRLWLRKPVGAEQNLTVRVWAWRL